MARDDPLAGQEVEDRYRLKHRIGSGGMSVVYLAELLADGRPAAIKFLRSAFASLPDFVQRFEQEAKACRLLDHPNCLSVMDYGVAFGSPYLVMEYLSGRPMSGLVAGGALPAEEAIGITRQILAGLRHAHERGVVHRDLKPGNVMLVAAGKVAGKAAGKAAGNAAGKAAGNAAGKAAGNAAASPSAELVKIMDFGTAQLLTAEGSRSRSGGSVGGGTGVGTPWYMAPEQAAGQPTDQRTDLYTVGVMLFELLTGERPYTAEDPMRVLQMHLSSPIPSARALKPEMGISPELEAAMVKALQKQPEDRFSSAEAFDDALQQTPEVQPRRATTGPMPAVDPTEPPIVASPTPRRATPSSPTPTPTPTPPPLDVDPPSPAEEQPNWTLLYILGGVALVVVVIVILFLTGLLSA
jgi:serine/threonine-protein kinase